MKRALLSVSDKTGVVDLARRLTAKGVTLLSWYREGQGSGAGIGDFSRLTAA